jgi:O-methyltransferase
MSDSSLRERLKRVAYRYLLAKSRMKFPTFGDDLHDTIGEKRDYFRYATLALALRRIEEEQVPGALAEVGVYRGETSEVIRRAAPGRTLYLFDTFGGFPEEDLEDWQKGDDRFRDTSLEAVRQRLGGADNVVFRPGRVPETLRGHEEERFAFVLLDLDLYEPTIQSLEFFYPRLAPGGYLAVHDYNNSESNWACKRALDTFMEGKPEAIVEIGDVCGTALIRRVKEG